MYTYEFDSFSFSFCPSINLNYVCENWQIVTLRFVKLFKLGWMALFVVKRTTMKVKGVIVSASSPHLRHLNFKKKWYKALHICNMYVEFVGKIIGISKINRFKLNIISVQWILASKIFWVWDAIVSPLLYKNSVKFSKMTKIIFVLWKKIETVG